MSLAQRTLKGIFWAYSSSFGGQILSLITTAILGRLLVPEDFGLVAFAVLFLAFIESVRSFGVNDALIYTSEKVDEAADTVFIINVVLGIAQFLIACLLAPLLVYAFDDPRIVSVAQVTALSMVINGFTQTHDALLQKELEFSRRFVPDMVGILVKGVFSIGMALTGFGIWSIVFGNLIGALSRTLIKWYVLKWRPRMRFYMDRAKALWNYGVHILVFHLLNIALEQADQLLIGVLLGQLQLGYYAIAMKIPELVISNLSMMLTRVLFPTYAKLKSDIDQLTLSFIATTRYTAFVTVPIGLGISAVAPEMVPLIFGEQWIPAVPLVQILSLMGMVATLPWSAGDVLKAIGRPDISTKLLLVETLYTFPMIYLMVVQTGLAIMAAIANLLSLMIAATIRLAVVTRFLDLRPVDFFHIFKAPFFAGAVMFATVTGWRVLTESWLDQITLITSILIGGVVYLSIMWMLERDAIMQAYDTLASTIRSRNLRPVEDGSDVG